MTFEMNFKTLSLFIILNFVSIFAQNGPFKFQRLGSRPSAVWGQRFTGPQRSLPRGSAQFSFGPTKQRPWNDRWRPWNERETTNPTSPKEFRAEGGGRSRQGPIQGREGPMQQQRQAFPPNPIEQLPWVLDNPDSVPILSLPKRKLEVYIESMSSQSYQFMHEQLNPVYRGQENELIPLTKQLEVEIYPGGAAQCTKITQSESSDDDYECQCANGPQECELNALMACVIHKMVDGDKYFNIILCLMGRPVDHSEDCFRHFGLPAQPYVACARSSFGRWLSSTVALQGSRLDPAMTHEPWLLIDGVSRPDAIATLRQSICDTFDHSFVPAGCPPDWADDTQII